MRFVGFSLSMLNFQQMHFDIGGRWERCFLSVEIGLKSDTCTEPKRQIITLCLFRKLQPKEGDIYFLFVFRSATMCFLCRFKKSKSFMSKIDKRSTRRKPFLKLIVKDVNCWLEHCVWKMLRPQREGLWRSLLQGHAPLRWLLGIIWFRKCPIAASFSWLQVTAYSSPSFSILITPCFWKNWKIHKISYN